MKIHRFFPVVILLLIGSAEGQQKFAPTIMSRNQAIATRQGKEYLAAMESLGAQSESAGQWVAGAAAYYQASVTAWLTGQLQKTIDHAAKALELAQKGKNSNLAAMAMMELATGYGDLRQPEKAREWLNKALEAVRKSNDDNRILQGNLSIVFGEFDLRQRDYRQAIEHLSQAVEIWDARLTDLKFTPGQGKIQNDVKYALDRLLVARQRLGRAYLLNGNFDQSIKVLAPAVELLSVSGMKASIDTVITASLGRAYLAQKDYPRALSYLTQALKKARARQHHSAIPEIGIALGQVYFQTDKPQAAVRFYKIALDSIESTRSYLQTEAFRTSFVENKGQTYEAIILASLRAKNLDEAFNYNERARSRAFLDILGSKIQLGRQAALIEEEQKLQERLKQLQVRSNGETDAASETQDDAVGEVDSGARDLAEAEKAYEDFLAKVKKENKEQASLMTVEPLTLKQVQGILDPNVTLLEYYVSRGAVWLWVVEKERVRFVTLPISRQDLRAKVNSLREAIAQPGETANLREQAQELFDILIRPALPQMSGKELLVIPHDVLHYLPFAALLSRQGNYLIQDFPINYLSSASLMLFTRDKKRARRETVLALGNPNLGDEAYNLRFAEREAREIAQVFPDSVILLKDQATKNKAVALAPDSDILHFAVHGRYNEEEPMNSALLLAADSGTDGALKASEIFALNLKADLVVLSACESGLGKIASGDEIIGLTRAFIYAGTPSVITTLWQVNDRASYELMRAFYAGLKTMNKAEALRQAQLKTMKEFPQPFFWAAYGLTGEP